MLLKEKQNYLSSLLPRFSYSFPFLFRGSPGAWEGCFWGTGSRLHHGLILLGGARETVMSTAGPSKCLCSSLPSLFAKWDNNSQTPLWDSFSTPICGKPEAFLFCLDMMISPHLLENKNEFHGKALCIT